MLPTHQTHNLSLHDALPIFIVLNPPDHPDYSRPNPNKGSGGAPPPTKPPQPSGTPATPTPSSQSLPRVIHQPTETRPNSGPRIDRKSTRLNSSHITISYAAYTSDPQSFPTRRSSDLHRAESAGSSGLLAAESEQGFGRRPATDEASATLGDAGDTDAIVPVAAARDPSANRDAPQQRAAHRSEEHTSELQSHHDLVCCLHIRPTIFPYTTLFRSSSC